MAIKHKKINPAKGQRALDELLDELKLTVDAIRAEQEFAQQIESVKTSGLSAKFPALDGRTASVQ